LRAYLRQRERLLDYAASHIQHMQKALTEMNLQSRSASSSCRCSARQPIFQAL
jgi:hypothetical protein